MADHNLPLNPTLTFKHISVHMVHVLARLQAKRLVQEQLRNAGVRVSLVPPREVAEKATAYLAEHPELWSSALARAHLIDDAEGRKKEKRKLRREQLARLDRPVCTTGSANRGTEKTQLFPTTSAIFRGSCLLFTF